MLVSDTSVVIDLERGGLIEAVFELPYTFSVPDLLFERELRAYGGDELIALGLVVVELNAAAVKQAAAYRDQEIALSSSDSFALALARENAWTLLAGDRIMREVANREHIDCHGLLWVLDELQRCSIRDGQTLFDGLTTISNHPRCRLPKREIDVRLRRFNS